MPQKPIERSPKSSLALDRAGNKGSDSFFLEKGSSRVLQLLVKIAVAILGRREVNDRR